MIDRILLRFEESVKNRILRTLLLHTIFWIVWLSRSIYDVYEAWGWSGGFIYIAVVFVCQVPLVYLHLYVLVPKLLNRKKYFPYLLLLTLSLFAYARMHYFLLHAIPPEWINERMYSFINSVVTPTFDLLEGAIAVILTYALKYMLIAFITQNELLRLQKEKLQLELNALKAQVHPHFLFNTLNNLYSLTLKNSDKASAVVLKLSDIMRYVLYQANDDRVPLQQEIEFIRNFTELQRLRYPEKFKIDLHVIGDSGKLQIAPLLFIDFVENAFKHGPDRSFTGGYVDISFQIAEENLVFKVSNSRGQEDESKKEKRKGLGLANVKKRLELIYPDKHELRISPSDDHYIVELKINLL